MQVAVLGAGFAAGVAMFVAWLAVMLREDRQHRMALIAATQEQTRAHRRAALNARATPPVRPNMPVVKAGSFCRVPGNLATTKQGTVLVCETNGTGRPRWRRAEVFQRAS